MSELPPSEPLNTDPKTILVGALATLQNTIIPLALVMFGTGGIGLIFAAPIALGVVLLGGAISFVVWKRLTYTIGKTDIRVDSGVLSRAARSVPYERIQDVSLEQKLIPRLLGLVAVKFETGAGGGEDLSLTYLTEERGEELRQLVRLRRDSVAGDVTSAQDGETTQSEEEVAEPLFTMGPRRLFTFGLFEFSLAVFAVLAGLLQYADGFIPFDNLDRDFWRSWFQFSDSGVVDQIAQAGPVTQALTAIAGLLAVFAIGSLTGMVRVYLRDWGFLLERTERGFRRRRGLFTRTDVVMPVHRVQGIKLSTGFVRYRFGWHGLKFVSLAQDMGASSHVVAPFAKLNEIAPIAKAAGFELAGEDADWHRASEGYLIDSLLLDALLLAVIAAAAGTAAWIYAREWFEVALGVPLVLGGLSLILNVFAWKFQRHALDKEQIVAAKGVISPRSQIAKRQKLHSVEISQGPFARLRGYATLHLGQGGGTFSIPGIPLERAREVRRQVLETIAATDFSELENA